MIQKQNTTLGQTLPDFSIAFGIFMVAVLIAFSSTTILFQPYQNTQERIGEADRIANRLTHTTLAEQGHSPYELDQDCVVSGVEALQGTGTTTYEKCLYSNNITSTTYNEYLGINENRHVKVVIIDGNESTVSMDGTTLEFGEDIPNVADTTNSYRMVQTNGDIYRLKVTTW